MKAILVKEAQNFERGGDSKVSMGIGKAGKAKKMLDDIYKDNRILTYKMNSLDDIEIHYTDRYKDRVRGSENKEPLQRWKLRYIEIPMYSAAPFEHKGYHSMDTHIYKYWGVYKTEIYNSEWPNSKIKETKLEIEISLENPEPEKKANLIVDAFNKEYGMVSGFELIETITIPFEEI
jgi:hypothetical protein